MDFQAKQRGADRSFKVKLFATPAQRGVVAAILVLAIAASASGEEREKVPLRTHAMVRSSVLTLADLLPANAPAMLRKAAVQISLGDAPEPPFVRTVYRQQLQLLLQNHDGLLDRLSIPHQITVERFYHMLTRDEIINTVRKEFGDDAGALKWAQLRFDTPVYVTAGNAGLRVIGIESEPGQGETQIRLWTANEPGNLPFEVTVPGTTQIPVLVAKHLLAPGERVSATDFAVELRPARGDAATQALRPGDFAGLEPRAALQAGQAVSLDDFKRPILVTPGTLATLVLHGNGFTIKTQVTPLQQGVLGEEIRVQNIRSKRIVEARVVGQDTLVKGGNQ